MPLCLDEIVERLGGQLAGDGKTVVSHRHADGAPRRPELLANPKYRSQLAKTRASAAVIVPAGGCRCPTAAILTPQPYLYFARVAQWLHAPVKPPAAHPTAVIHSAVPASASIGANLMSMTMSRSATMSSSAPIAPGSRMPHRRRLTLARGVAIYAGCVIGDRAIVIPAPSSAPTAGFAREDDGAWLKIPQTGRVVIGDDVEIGANTTIDRGAIDDTIIETGGQTRQPDPDCP